MRLELIRRPGWIAEHPGKLAAFVTQAVDDVVVRRRSPIHQTNERLLARFSFACVLQDQPQIGTVHEYLTGGGAWLRPDPVGRHPIQVGGIPEDRWHRVLAEILLEAALEATQLGPKVTDARPRR